jgi:hypothetical protein
MPSDAVLNLACGCRDKPLCGVCDLDDMTWAPHSLSGGPIMIGTIARTGLVAFAAAAFTVSGAGAGTIYDGSWSLTIVTERGACDRYNLPVQISNGHVTFPGLVKAHGRVTRKGFVRVSVSAMGKTASGSGRLSRSAGRGRWAGRSGTDRCSGSWIAYRS